MQVVGLRARPYSRAMVALAPPPPPPIYAPCPAAAKELHAAAKCGYVVLPLDRTRPDGKTIRVYFERYPRRNSDVPRESTIVSIEGGPGYPVTEDRIGRVELWEPLSSRHDLVLVDLRGTGGAPRSAARRSRADPSTTSRARGAAPSRSGRSATSTRPRRASRTSRRSCARSTRAASTCTATPTGRMQPRPTRCASRSACARSRSTAPTRCRARTRRGPTSSRRSASGSCSRAPAHRAARPGPGRQLV